jgi:tetratricopeptide (TPR) repeat protein
LSNISIEKIKTFIQLQKWNESIVEATRAIKSNPQMADLYFYRGYAKLMTEDLNAALTDFNACLEINPKHNNGIKNKAICLFRSKNYEMAAKEYSKLIVYDESNAELYLFRGISLLETKSYDAAVKDFSSAIDLNKSFAEAYFNRANAYSKLFESRKACKDIKEAYKLGYVEAKAHIHSLCED